MKILLIGAGKGGSALLSILHEDKEIEIVGVVDNNQNAEGLKIARQYNIPTYPHYENLIKREDLDVIIDVTRNPQVHIDIAKNKPTNTEILGGLGAKLIWSLVEERKKRKSKKVSLNRRPSIGSELCFLLQEKCMMYFKQLSEVAWK